MPQIKSSFILNSKSPNFSRDFFHLIKDMKNVDPDHIDNGHISYCAEDKQHYKFDESYGFDSILGYWRPLLSKESEVYQGVIQFDTKNDMLHQIDPVLYKLGQISYCKEDDQHYYWAVDENMSEEELTEIYNADTGYFLRLLRIPAEYENYFKSDLHDVITGIDVGGIQYGTQIDDIKGKHYNKILEDMLFGQVLPKYEDPTASIAISSRFKGLMRVGEIAPRASDFNLDASRGSIYYEKSNGEKIVQGPRAGEWITHNQIAQKVSYVYYKGDDDIQTQLPDTIQLGKNEYVHRAYFKESPIPVDNRGEQLIDMVWKNSEGDLYIDSNDSIVILGTKPWYASTNGLEEQELIEWSDDILTPMITLKPTSVSEQIIKTPRPVKNIYMCSGISSTMVDMDLLPYKSTYDGEYYMYTYDHNKFGHRGEIKLRIRF